MADRNTRLRSSQIRNLTILTEDIANNAIDENKIATSVAGNGLTGGGGSVLSVNVDDSTLEISSDILRIKDEGVTEAKLDIFNSPSDGKYLQYDNTNGMQWADVSGGLSQSIGTFTRATNSQGTQSITGLGFQPSAVIIFWTVTNQSDAHGHGFGDGTNNYSTNWRYNSWAYNTSHCIYWLPVGTRAHKGAITSLDSDGFTVTWSTSGSSSQYTETFQCVYLALA